VSLSIDTGEVLGLVGESGAGKSMIGKAILGHSAVGISIIEGEILLDGQDLEKMRPADRRRLIGSTAALIPQDPLTALNPSRRIEPQITNRLVDILGWSKADARVRAMELLDEVHIDNPERVMGSYPHELSGGMRQRVLIASAFAANPKLVIADEPTTALDVTVQKQILRLDPRVAATPFHRDGVRHPRSRGRLEGLPAAVGALRRQDCREFRRSRVFRRPETCLFRALLAATPKYTDPDASLLPVDESVIEAVAEEVLAADKEWRHGR
jgi:peptide/nickel transport system ATP-binding protein